MSNDELPAKTGVPHQSKRRGKLHFVLHVLNIIAEDMLLVTFCPSSPGGGCLSPSIRNGKWYSKSVVLLPPFHSISIVPGGLLVTS